MTDWTEGYRADIDYTYGYYGELNPLRADLALLAAGIAPPQPVTACELGFGQGLSLNLHAAASGVQWFGTDFNPSQAAFAQHLAKASGAKLSVFDEAFEQFCLRSDLPDFDYIGVHGIWSWISDHNRKVMTDFLRRKLKVGGVLYMSYNTMPGWAVMVPVRHLLTQHAEVMAAHGRGITSRIEAALEFSDKLLALNPAYARLNPSVAERLKKIKGQNRHYVAHEYFNQDWQPMSFADMAGWLEPAKLSYACSANPLDNVDAVNLTRDAQAFLKDIPDPMFRETTRDFIVNQQFRRDYWIKGVRRLPTLEQAEGLRRLRYILLTPRDEVTLKAPGAMGEATMSDAIYPHILDALADQKPHSVGEIEKAVKAKSVTLAQVIEAIMVLTGKGDAVLVQNDALASSARKACNSLNSHLTSMARGSAAINYLASPLTGGGIAVERLQQLFLLAIAGGAKTPADWAKAAWGLLSVQGQRVMKDGKALEGDAANLAEIESRAQDFAKKRLPLLKTLMVA
ncbi:MAG: methyltransferase regulatory domain-containing protein [Hyphomicrobium sp.]